MVPDILFAGYVTRDRVNRREQPGGSAFYGAHTARKLGLSVGIWTSADSDFLGRAEWAGIRVATGPGRITTMFTHDYDPGSDSRVSRLNARAEALDPGALPFDWRQAPRVILAPNAWEVTPETFALFDAPWLAFLPQGWFRSFAPDGAVSCGPGRWKRLPRGVILSVASEDDLAGDPGGGAGCAGAPAWPCARGAGGDTSCPRRGESGTSNARTWRKKPTPPGRGCIRGRHADRPVGGRGPRGSGPLRIGGGVVSRWKSPASAVWPRGPGSPSASRSREAARENQRAEKNEPQKPAGTPAATPQPPDTERRTRPPTACPGRRAEGNRRGGGGRADFGRRCGRGTRRGGGVPPLIETTEEADDSLPARSNARMR